MTAGDHLGQQFEFQHRDRSPYGGTVEAYHDENKIGDLDYAPDGFVEHVRVKEPYRRQGVATSLLHHMPVSPSFSDQGNTPEGDAWIASVQRGK